MTHAGHICSTVYQDAHERLAGLQTAPHRINRHLAQSTGVGQDAVLAAHLHRCTNRLSQDHVPPFFRFSCHFCREGVFDQELMLNAQISVFVQLNPRSGLGSKCAIRHLGPAMAAV